MILRNMMMRADKSTTMLNVALVAPPTWAKCALVSAGRSHAVDCVAGNSRFRSGESFFGESA